MPFTTEQRCLFVVRVVISLAVLGCALFIVVSGSYSETRVEWAAGLVGLVIGYWLR